MVKVVSSESKATNKLSVSGINWVLRDTDERLALAISQRFNLPLIVANVISSRGVLLDEVESFLYPSIKETLPNPAFLNDIDKATIRIIKAINNNEKIVVFGDYDVDGATSSSLLIRYFRKIGIEIGYYIPDRINEGYGPNSDALIKLKQQGYDLCITVDCGTMSFEPLESASNIGLDVIVIDHHLSSEELPKAIAVVNPNRLDDDFPVKNIAAVAVSFLVLVFLNSELEKAGWFEQSGKQKPNLLNFLDIVALGTVCDVMPLTGVNRAFVAQGLKILQRRQNIGLRALSDISGILDTPSSYHLGYALGPRINAGGRVGKSDLGTRLLISEDVEQADIISRELHNFNAERKTLEQQVLEQAIQQIESEEKNKDAVIFAVGENWHPGVIGIVASRLKERYYRPAAVISLDNGIGKASARSIYGIDFGSNIVAANQSGLLLAGGGHAMAAGFTVEENKINQLQEFLNERFSKNKQAYQNRIIKADGYLSISGMTVDLLQKLSALEPYGTGNSEPKFIIKNVQLVKWDILKGEHIRCFIRDGFSGGSAATIKAMAFRSVETAIGESIFSLKPSNNFDLLCKPKLNTWQGVSKVELIIEDIAI